METQAAGALRGSAGGATATAEGHSTGNGGLATVRSIVPTSPRAAVHSVSVVPSGGRCTVSVELRRGDDRAMGVAEGVMATSVARRVVADAVISALATLEPDAGNAALDAVVIGPVGGQQVVTATVVLALPPHEELLAGAAVVRAAGEHDAIARAVLDALNRRLSSAPA